MNKGKTIRPIVPHRRCILFGWNRGRFLFLYQTCKTMAGTSYMFSDLKWKITQQLPYFIRYEIHLVARLQPYHMRTTLPLTI